MGLSVDISLLIHELDKGAFLSPSLFTVFIINVSVVKLRESHCMVTAVLLVTCVLDALSMLMIIVFMHN